MIANELERILKKMYEEASQWRHEMVGLEHLLLALIEYSETVRHALQQCDANL